MKRREKGEKRMGERETYDLIYLVLTSNLSLYSYRIALAVVLAELHDIPRARRASIPFLEMEYKSGSTSSTVVVYVPKLFSSCMTVLKVHVAIYTS